MSLVKIVLVALFIVSLLVCMPVFIGYLLLDVKSWSSLACTFMLLLTKLVLTCICNLSVGVCSYIVSSRVPFQLYCIFAC